MLIYKSLLFLSENRIFGVKNLFFLKNLILAVVGILCFNILL